MGPKPENPAPPTLTPVSADLVQLRDRVADLEGRSDELTGQHRVIRAWLFVGAILMLGAAVWWVRDLRRDDAERIALHRIETSANLDALTAEMSSQLRIAFESLRRVEDQIELLKASNAALVLRQATTETKAASLSSLLVSQSNSLVATETDVNDLGAKLFEVAQDSKGSAEDGFGYRRKLEGLEGTVKQGVRRSEQLGAEFVGLRESLITVSNQVQSTWKPLKAWIERVSELEKRLVSAQKTLAILSSRPVYAPAAAPVASHSANLAAPAVNKPLPARPLTNSPAALPVPTVQKKTEVQ